MKIKTIIILSCTALIALMLALASGAQESGEYGVVLSVSENSASITFENRTLYSGDEISIVRRINIVDPFSGDIKGGRYETVATGVVGDAGIERSSVSILWKSPKYDSIELTDQVEFIGRTIDLERANIVIGKVQNLLIDSREIEIDFGEEDVNQGDMFLIQRTEYTYDPDTNEIIDTQVVEVGRGRINKVGDTSSLGEIIVNPGYEIDFDTDDIVINNSKIEPEVIQPRDEVVGRIQELVSDSLIDIDVGAEEAVNEGDLFLIQRIENTIDPDTNEIVESVQVEIGRGTVSLLAGHSSRGELELNPEYELNLETDNVVFEAITDVPYEAAFDEPVIASQGVRREIDDLKRELFQLRATVDSLGIEHTDHRNEFDSFKNEIEMMFSKLMSGDMDGTKIIIKNDEPFTPNISASLTSSYQQALDNCLTNRFDRAIEGFETIVRNYPNSKLTENCRYWIAQSYYGMRDYGSAINGFKAVIADNRFTHKKDDASIMLGICHYLAGNQSEALVEFQKFFIHYPDSEYRDKVSYWIKRLS